MHPKKVLKEKLSCYFSTTFWNATTTDKEQYYRSY